MFFLREKGALKKIFSLARGLSLFARVHARGKFLEGGGAARKNEKNRFFSLFEAEPNHSDTLRSANRSASL